MALSKGDTRIVDKPLSSVLDYAETKRNNKTAQQHVVRNLSPDRALARKVIEALLEERRVTDFINNFSRRAAAGAENSTLFIGDDRHTVTYCAFKNPRGSAVELLAPLIVLLTAVNRGLCTEMAKGNGASTFGCQIGGHEERLY